MKRICRTDSRMRSPGAPFCLVEPLEVRRVLSTTVPNIMPLGDSITEAFTGHASYRYWLWNELADQGHVLDFVGSQTPAGVADGPPLLPGFDAHHEGHVGFRADDIDAMLKTSQWKDFTIQPQNKPDIVLLHIGSNDVEQGQTDASTRVDIGRIINDLRVVNPNVTILLAQIIPEANVSVSGLNSQLPTVVANKNTAQSPVILVDQFTGFDAATDTYDGVHPNESGEKKIAAKWLAALTPLLPAPTAPAEGVYLDSGEVPLTNASTSVGPVEYEMSNGGDDTFDGQMLTLRSQSYMRGFGVHGPAELDFDLSGGTYTNFLATLGIDDEVGGEGSVEFQVFVNNEATPRYTSGVLTGTDAAVNVDVDITGATSLRLVTTDGGNDNDFDHADWANARLIAGTVQPPTQPPTDNEDVPSAPRRLNAKWHGKKIDLCWKDTSDNETGFMVERKDGINGQWHQIAELAANSRKYRDTNFTAGTGYAYRVSAFNDAGASDTSNVDGEFVPPRKNRPKQHDSIDEDDNNKGQNKLRNAVEKWKKALWKLFSFRYGSDD